MGSRGNIDHTRFSIRFRHDVVGLTVTDYVDAVTKCSVMDEMLAYLNEDGIMQVSCSRLIIQS